MVKFCPSCAAELPQDYHYCFRCGEHVEFVAPEGEEEEDSGELSPEERAREFWVGLGCMIFVVSFLTIAIGAIFFSYK